MPMPMPMHRRPLVLTVALAVAATACALAAPAAEASLVAFVRDSGPKRGAVVVYESAPRGQTVEVRRAPGRRTIRVTGRSGVQAGPGCAVQSRTEVRCQWSRRELRVDLGVGRDAFRARPIGRFRIVVRGGAGNDQLRVAASSSGDLDGGDGNDLLVGAARGDTLLGGPGDDRLYGNTGADRLYGGIGNDLLDGAAGNDLLNPGQGLDTVAGGSGGDRIRLRDTPPVYDRADCGTGRDRVISRDRADHRGAGCERR